MSKPQEGKRDFALKTIVYPFLPGRGLKANAIRFDSFLHTLQLMGLEDPILFHRFYEALFKYEATEKHVKRDIAVVSHAPPKLFPLR